jgi:hypothetical protein
MGFKKGIGIIAVICLLLSITDFSTFELRAIAAVPGDTIALKAYVNGKIVTAEDGGSSPLIANRDHVGSWEKFQIVDAGNGKIALKALVNNKYVTAANATTPLIASATSIGTNEKFTMETASDGRTVFKAANNKYVTAENKGNDSLIARADTIGVWEKFDMLVNPLDGTKGGYTGVTFGFRDQTMYGGPYTQSGDTIYNLPLFKAAPNDDALFWDNYVEEMDASGIDFVAPTIRGYLDPAVSNSNEVGDPRKLSELVSAIQRRGSNLKISLLDDIPNSWMKKKNLDKYGDDNNRPKFDIGDADGTGEGGYKYVWDNNYRAFFQAVPDNMRFKLDNKPVIYLWNLGDSWFTNYGNGNAKKLLDYVRSRCQIEFGFDPFIIVQDNWLTKDPTVASTVDGVHSWFNGNSPLYSLTDFNGRSFGIDSPAFEKYNEGQYTDPNHGLAFNDGLDHTVGAGAFVTLVEGFSDWPEGNAVWRVKDGGYSVTHYDYLSQRINILRRYTSHPKLYNERVEAEAADLYYDTTSGNTGGVYRDGDIDVQATTDTLGGYNVGFIEPGEWLEWEAVPIEGTYHLRVRVASNNTGKRLRFVIDGVNQSWINIPNTGGWQTWQTVDGGTYTLSSGTHTIRIYTDTGGYNLNYWINN